MASNLRVRNRAQTLAGGLLLALLAVSARTAPGQRPRVPQEQVESVFLFHFAEFVKWPSSGTPAFAIGVLGDDPLGGFLDETVRGEKAGGRPIVVWRFARADEIVRCDILFVSASERPRMDGILATLRHRSILTVSDADGFAKKGGMIQFTIQGGKTRLKVNLAAAQAAGLTISSKLLRSAEIVGTEK